MVTLCAALVGWSMEFSSSRLATVPSTGAPVASSTARTIRLTVAVGVAPARGRCQGIGAGSYQSRRTRGSLMSDISSSQVGGGGTTPCCDRARPGRNVRPDPAPGYPYPGGRSVLVVAGGAHQVRPAAVAQAVADVLQVAVDRAD